MRMKRHKNDMMDFGDSGGEGGKVLGNKKIQIEFTVYCLGAGCIIISQITTKEFTDVVKYHLFPKNL